MGALAIIIFGVFLAGNVAILKWKVERERYADAALDFTVLVALAWIFGGTITGLAIATIASSIISLYLMASSPDKLIERFKGSKKTGSRHKKRKRYA